MLIKRSRALINIAIIRHLVCLSPHVQKFRHVFLVQIDREGSVLRVEVAFHDIGLDWRFLPTFFVDLIPVYISTPRMVFYVFHVFETVAVRRIFLDQTLY